MDERIRRLERSGDYARAGRLRCKVEGCLKPGLREVTTHHDMLKMRQVFVFVFDDGRRTSIEVREHVLFSLIYGGPDLEEFKNNLSRIAITMAKCSRCDKDNDMKEAYLTSIYQKMIPLFK